MGQLLLANYNSGSSGDGQEEAEMYMRWHARMAGQDKQEYRNGLKPTRDALPQIKWHH